MNKQDIDNINFTHVKFVDTSTPRHHFLMRISGGVDQLHAKLDFNFNFKV